MPFIDSDDLERRKNSPSNLANRLNSIKVGNVPQVEHHIIKPQGKTEGSLEVPLAIKKTLAVLANESKESQKSLAKEFGVSQTFVSDMKRGIQSAGNGNNVPSKDLAPTLRKIKDRREDAESKAIDLVLQGLEVLPEKLAGASLRNTLSAVKTMSEVADRMSGKDGESGSRVVLHLYAPEQKDSSYYPVIDITPLEGN